jgi:Holliday junction resolvase RusA-like endonuclease
MPVMVKGRPLIRNGRPVVNMVDSASQGKRGVAYKAWRKAIETTARLVFRDPQPLIYPIELTAIFFVARPQGHYGTGRNAGQLKDNAPAVPTTKPDATKMLRLVEDCLSGIIWVDDNNVVDQVCRKRYALNGRTGVAIRIDPVIY